MGAAGSDDPNGWRSRNPSRCRPDRTAWTSSDDPNQSTCPNPGHRGRDSRLRVRVQPHRLIPPPSRKPCQDAYALWTGSGAGTSVIAVAVADGHGDDRHDLSHFGSTLAVRAAVEELGALHTCYALEGKWTELKSSFKADFPRRLGRRWRAVLGEQTRRSDAPHSEPEEALLIRHGTTLIAALVVGDVLLIGQIGDGGVLLLTEGCEVECPLPNNPLEVGGETDSLGSVDAPRLCERLRWSGQGPASCSSRPTG